MKKKSLLLTAVAMLGLTAATLAQNVPNYVPTNGLIGWWPFSGNANDESGNGNNGTVNGANLAIDRDGVSNSAYSFNGLSNNIVISNNASLNINTGQSLTISCWLKYDLSSTNIGKYFISKYSGVVNTGQSFALGTGFQGNGYTWHQIASGNPNGRELRGDNTINDGQWHFITSVLNMGNTSSFYVDGILDSTVSFPLSGSIINSINLYFGCGANLSYYYKGALDDIGIWNRALTQQEITDLYNAVNCANNATITPQTNTLTTGSTATFTASTSDPNPSYLWQCDFGQGFQTLNNFGNYSGTNTANLNIANIQLPNHTQPIRVITTSVNCIDTSNVATISIADTCINTVTDTTLITVTDTLIINSTIAALNPPNNSNTIKLFPNPANDHITINYGNFTVMNGYQLKIENSLGQQVFQTNITQQSDYLNLTTWGGNGLYFVHIINPQGNTIDIRKIVLQ